MNLSALALDSLHDDDARRMDAEAQALFVADSDRLEATFREHYRRYQVFGMGWPSIVRVVASVQEWPDWRTSDDAFVAEIRQFGNQYGWSPCLHCLARAMADHGQKGQS